MCLSQEYQTGEERGKSKKTYQGFDKDKNEVAFLSLTPNEHQSMKA